MNIAPAISKKIEATLKAFISNPEPYLIRFDNSLDLRKIADELHILPMLLDMGGCYAIRPNGEIVSFSWDEPHILEVEKDPRMQNIVIFQGSKKYPELDVLVPPRPPNAHDCNGCNGTGTIVGLPPDLAENVVCYCGGLGWLL